MMPSTTFLETSVAILAAVGFAFLEWRRADRRHLPARLVATLLAVAALALLGLHPTWRHVSGSPSAEENATLWTSAAVAATPDANRDFALPDAARFHPAAQPIPDVAYLRRHFPAFGTLRILGDGLDPAELDAWRGLRIRFDPPPSATLPAGIRFLRCPREIPLGDSLIVQGQIGGLKPGASVRLTLEAPDGTAAHVDTAPAAADGTAPFELHAAPLSAAGRFVWRLRVPALGAQPAADLPLGVAVVSPTLPRILVLESAPRFDTAALRRWFGAAGGTLIARTRVGQNHDQYTSAAASSPPPSFAALDTSLLAGFDLLLADARSLLALPPAERDALLAAVESGLGVLVLADDAPPPVSGSAGPDDAGALLPWKLSALPTDPPGADRPARLRWAGQTTPTDLPIPTAPFEIAAPGPAPALPLVSDHAGHTLAAALSHGRGQLALTLVRETARWQREDDPAAFAAYWSFLFSRLARPASAADRPRWSLAEGDAGPVFADHPLTLQWTGPTTSPPGLALVDGTTTLALAPAGDSAAAPGRWQGMFWPRRAGWHRVALASGGPAFDFHVSTADAWPALAAARRRAATERLADASAVVSPAPAGVPAAREEVPSGWWAALFFAAAGYLWIERRFAW